ncbi:MAG TPA: hypothetical protein VKI44_03795 [Acetobacteraceae bacterium]|nr:hypothetical protein [Acetobacteraceae bacterium]
MTAKTVSTTRRIRNALLGASAMATIGVAHTATAQIDVAKYWYTGGGFTVKEMVATDPSDRWCSLERGIPGSSSPYFILDTSPGGLLMIADSNMNWSGGQVRIWVDGKFWTARATVPPAFPHNLNVSLGYSQPLVDFMTALALGRTLTIEGLGSAGVGAFRYNVSLNGSAGAIKAQIECSKAVDGTPAVQPRASATTVKTIV